MDRKRLYEIILDKWIPALITAVIGGLVIAYLAPRIQTKLASELALTKRKLDLWESVGSGFTDYLQWRRRLITLSSTIQSAAKGGETVPKDSLERQETYRTERDKHLDILRRDLFFINYYFGKPVQKVTSEFLDWHQKFATATIDKLPSSEEYYKWRDIILLEMRSELY